MLVPSDCVENESEDQIAIRGQIGRIQACAKNGNFEQSASCERR